MNASDPRADHGVELYGRRGQFFRPGAAYLMRARGTGRRLNQRGFAGTTFRLMNALPTTTGNHLRLYQRVPNTTSKLKFFSIYAGGTARGLTTALRSMTCT